MRLITTILRRAAVPIAATMLVIGPPMVLVANVVTAGHPAQAPGATSAVPQTSDTPRDPWIGGSASADPAQGQVSVAAGPGPQPQQLIVPDLFAVGAGRLDGAQIARIGRLPGVRAVLAVDGGQVSVNGASATVLGVQPTAFRSWTPPGTAAATGIWTALEAGDLMTTDSAASRLGLTLGDSYQVTGTATASVRFTAIAPFGIPGADVIVDGQRSAQLGLAPDVAVLISAPAADYATLVPRIRAAIGARATVVNLVPVTQSRPLPVISARPGRPANWLQLYQDSAALYCPGLSWTVLAAIGEIESGNGTNDGPSSAGALGPMQFMPATWAAWGIEGFGQTEAPDIMDPLDAVPSAARMLCADGAVSGGTGLPDAIWDYNHADWYVTEVLQLAAEYAHDYS
jgi:hypothetical protein